MKNKKMRLMVVIFMMVIVMFTGTVQIISTSISIIKTSLLLEVLNLDAQYYNEQPVKTDEMTDDFIRIQDERDSIYNSDNAVIREFSRRNALIKLPLLILAILSFPIIGTVWICMYNVIRFFIMRNRRKMYNRSFSKRRSASAR